MRIAIRQKFVFNDAMEKANRIEVALLYCAVLYEVMPHTYLIMHKQAILKVSLQACMQFCCLGVYIANVNCARMLRPSCSC